MQFFYQTLLPNGSNLWFASAVPSAAGDLPGGFSLYDQVSIVGGPNAGSLYVCTVAGAPGTWQKAGSSAIYGANSPTQFNVGNQAIENSLQGVDTTDVTNDIFIGAVAITANVTLTGIAFLVGSVGGTDKAIAILYSSTGAVLATSALAGVTIGTAATVQSLPFTAPIAVTPGLYFVGISVNGTTAHIRTVFFGTAPTAIVTTQTFGTPTSITPPTSFTTGQSPVAQTY